MKINDKVMFITFYQDKPAWLPGTVKHIMEEVQHYTILVRKDYRGLIDGNSQAVVPRQFVFDTVESADKWADQISKNLTDFVTTYDSSEETWKSMTTALTWQPLESTDVPLVASGDIPPAEGSAP